MAFQPADSGAQVLELEHGSVVSSVAFSPCGKQLLTGSDDCKARLFDKFLTTLDKINFNSGLVGHAPFNAANAMASAMRRIQMDNYPTTTCLQTELQFISGRVVARVVVL